MNEVMRAGLAILLFFFAAAASAQRGETCRFAALDAENPFRRWLASQEVTCVPAGSPLDFPPGLWNVFARSDYDVSAAPLLVDSKAPPVSIVPELVPAATVLPLLPVGFGGVIYAPRRGSAIPVDRARVTVPADEPLWLFVLDKSEPIVVVSIPPLAPRSVQSVDGRVDGSSVLGWLQVPEPERGRLAEAAGVAAPAVRAGSRLADPLPPLPPLHGAFVRIEDVPVGTAELRLEGRDWIPDRRVVNVRKGVTVVAAPLLLRAAGTLVVYWNTDQDLPALDASVETCDAGGGMPPRLVIALLKCPVPRGERDENAECTLVHEEPVADFFGSLTFDGLEPGLYRGEMRFGKLAPARAMRSVAPLGVSDLRITATYLTAYGAVKRGREPLGEDAAIRFPSGIGFAAADTGEYRAVLLPPPVGTDAEITVAPCRGAPQSVLTDQPMRSGGHLDIDIPLNELIVRVSDTFTRDALPGATVKLEAMALSRRRIVLTKSETTDEQGTVAWTGLPVREMHLTVTHAGYEKKRVEPFTMIRSGDHAVDVQLVPLRGTRGRIVSDRNFDGGVVVWFSPAGSEVERADLAPDGTFVFNSWHTAEETMAVVSASHPLWVQRAPELERRESLTLRFPSAPAVAFDVALSAAVLPHVTRYIGVAIGGVRVPQPLLAQHQILRGDPPIMRGTGPQRFRDLLATGPVEVLLGPTVEEVAAAARGLDIFAFPKFAAAPRQTLQPGSDRVVFSWR